MRRYPSSRQHEEVPLRAQTGKAVTAPQANVLSQLAGFI
jgi:hypothetical protein